MKCSWIHGACLFALLVCASSAFAQKPKKGKTGTPDLIKHPGLVADMATTPVVIAKQKCENFAWAAALETTLRMQGAPLDQLYWVNRIDGGEVCLRHTRDPEDLIRYLEREPITLDDGRRMTLHVAYAPGPPSAMDLMIRSVQQSRPLIIFWRGHARILSGITYDEYVAVTGAHVFEVREMRLIDPYLPEKDPNRISKFVKGTDPASDFEGLMVVQVAWEPSRR